MSAFDDIFRPADRAKSALFADLPAQPKQSAKKTSKASVPEAAIGGGGLNTQPTKAAKPAKSGNAKKRQQQNDSDPQPTKAAKKQKVSRLPAAPTAAAPAEPAAVQQRQRPAPQKPVKAAAGARATAGQSAAASAAAAAAAKLLKQQQQQRQQTGGQDSDAEAAPPPLHETLQRQTRQQRQQRAKAKKQKRQAQAAAAVAAAAPEVATPAERAAADGEAAADAEAAAQQPLDTAADGVEQAQGNSLEDNLDRTVFVGNLRATTKPKAVKQLFSSYGKVESVRLRSVPVALDAGMPRRAAVLLGKVDADRATAHAYVVFSSPEQARAALAHNMRVVDGLHLRVDMATGASGTAGAKTYSRGRSIFVGNLHFAAQDEDLVRLFSDGALDPELADAVTAVRVVRDRKTNIGKGIAFIEFKTKAAAAAAMRLSEPKLNGRPLRISFLKQPKAGASAAAAATAATDLKPGQQSGSQIARARIQQRDVAGGKKAAAQPWMGMKTKGPLKLSAKPKGPAQQAAKKPRGAGGKAAGNKAPGKAKRAKAGGAKGKK